MSIRNKIPDNIFKFPTPQVDYNKLLDMIGNSRFVLIGESTHGTHEFYKIRAELTKLLIEKKSFNAVAIEGDWPDVYNINRYVKGSTNTKLNDSISSLSGFKRFPTWMWRNEVVLNFVDWLQEYNSTQSPPSQAGFYGLDLYSLSSSAEEIINQLNKIDKKEAEKASERYGCFSKFKKNLTGYGYARSLGLIKDCGKSSEEQLNELISKIHHYLKEGKLNPEEAFSLEQNARLICSAERYYRSIVDREVSSWNIRDNYIGDTLYRIEEHLTNLYKKPAKIAVWAHNSHIGDARATEMGKNRNEINLGQLVREKSTDESFILGFMTNTGTVTAASDWDGEIEKKRVRTAIKDSYENYFHELGDNLLVDLRSKEVRNIVPTSMLERAIGVIYRPETERFSHYFYANLSKQFDALIYLNETKALAPLEKKPSWHKGEAYDTYPFGV